MSRSKGLLTMLKYFFPILFFIFITCKEPVETPVPIPVFSLDTLFYFPGQWVTCESFVAADQKVWWTSTLNGDSTLSSSNKIKFQIPINQATGRFLVSLKFFNHQENNIFVDSITKEIVIYKTNGFISIHAFSNVKEYTITYNDSITVSGRKTNLYYYAGVYSNVWSHTFIPTGKNTYVMSILRDDNSRDTLKGNLNINYLEHKVCAYDNIR